MNHPTIQINYLQLPQERQANTDLFNPILHEFNPDEKPKTCKCCKVEKTRGDFKPNGNVCFECMTKKKTSKPQRKDYFKKLKNDLNSH